MSRIHVPARAAWTVRKSCCRGMSVTRDPHMSVIDLAPEYADGRLTHRIVADTLDISRGWAFDILDEVTPLVVNELPKSETFTPDDIGDDERASLLADDPNAAK